MLVRHDASGARLLTRNGHDWTAKLRPLQSAFEGLKLPPVWYDGEAVVPNVAGVPDFGALQQAFGTQRAGWSRHYSGGLSGTFADQIARTNGTVDITKTAAPSASGSMEPETPVSHAPRKVQSSAKAYCRSVVDRRNDMMEFPLAERHQSMTRARRHRPDVDPFCPANFIAGTRHGPRA
ncbi:hypothetical protein [Rhodoferax sp.]|uniref:hypothetical protein n=1 Tax=Rhodoferax sp. TaxID=50421 RepID=UPI0039B8467C